MGFAKQLEVMWGMAAISFVTMAAMLGPLLWDAFIVGRGIPLLRCTQVQVVMISKQEGCHLSKVRLYDDKGVLYPVPGCNSGKVVLAPGRGFGWVEHLGQETVGFSVYVSH